MEFHPTASSWSTKVNGLIVIVWLRFFKFSLVMMVWWFAGVTSSLVSILSYHQKIYYGRVISPSFMSISFLFIELFYRFTGIFIQKYNMAFLNLSNFNGCLCYWIIQSFGKVKWDTIPGNSRKSIFWNL